MSFLSLGTWWRLQTISLVLSFLSKRRPQVSSSLFFFLALHTDRFNERTVMVMSWTQTLLQGFLWLSTMVAVTWLTAMSVRVQLHSGRAPATRREVKLGRTIRRRWRDVTSGVANTCAEDENQPWVNGEKKFVYHGARWLGSHARQLRYEKWSGRGKAVQNRGKRSRKAKPFRRRPCRRVAARLANANVIHTSLGLLGRQCTWRRSTSVRSWTSYTAVLNISSGFWQKLLFLCQQSVQSRVIEVMNAQAFLDIPDCSCSMGNSVVLHRRKHMAWKIWMDS